LELTFRDPAGELRLMPDCALRRIRPAAEEETRAFLSSPLRKTLEQSGDLISSRIAEPGSHPCIASGEFWLEHPRIDPISYPWEWSTAQWRAAAELTLRIASQAIFSFPARAPSLWTFSPSSAATLVPVSGWPTVSSYALFYYLLWQRSI
jgi:hypothetical protein